MGKLAAKAQQITAAARELTTVDGWENLVTGMGVRGKDKSRATSYRSRGRSLRWGEIDALYREDGMASKVVDDIVEDAFRCGWKVTFQTDEDEKANAEKVNEFNANLEKWHRRVGFKDRAEEHMKQSRWAGGSLLILGAKDGGEPMDPLEPDKVKSIDWVRPVDRFQLSESGVLEANPASHNFGMPIFYWVTSIVSSSGAVNFTDTNALGQVTLSTQNESGGDIASLNDVRIHNSRAWRSDGVTLSDRARIQNGGWGDSVLERAYTPLMHWTSAMLNTGTIIQDFSQGVYKIKGLKELLAAGKESLVLKRFNMMDRVRSVVNAIIADADGEEFERKTTNVAGLSDLIDRNGHWLSAVSGMPLTKLFGLSPGGFGTGESEGENWDDKVKAWQEKKLKPLLEYVYGLLFNTPEFAGVPDGWAIEFEALQLESPEKTAERKNKNAQTDAAYVASGVLSPKEVAVSRFGGAKYGDDIDLNMEARESMSGLGGEDIPDDEAARLNAEAAGIDELEIERGSGASIESETTDVQKTALNGAQIAELKQMILDVRNGDMPGESAMAQALYSFPTMTEAEARAMIGPAMAAAEREPKSDPVQPPPFPPNAPPQSSARGAAPDSEDEGLAGKKDVK